MMNTEQEEISFDSSTKPKEEVQNDNDLILKKNLLQKEIIDKEYNKEQFLYFCSIRKNGGDDLTTWSLEELRACISQYVKYQEEEKAKKELEDQKIIQNQQKEKEIHLSIGRLENFKMTNSTKIINCKVLEKTILNDKKVVATLRNPQIVQTSLFNANFITYEVYTDLTKWLVRRRYSDFIWLRSILKKLYPRFFTPPLPNKKIGGRRFENDFVDKRMQFLVKFLNAVLENETFKACDALICFLSMTDRNQFEFKMKEFTSLAPCQYVEEVKTLTGKLKLQEDSENDGFYQNISNYLKLQTQLYERLNYNLKNFYCNIDAACTNLDEVQKDFEFLSLLNNRVILRNEITKTYDELAVFFKNWRRVLSNQNETIKSYVRDFFKYEKMECVAFTELIYDRENLKNNYVSSLKKLNAKKEKMWAKMDITKWEIVDEFETIDKILLFRDKTYACAKMCTKETQFVEGLHKQLNYANNMNYEELKKIVDKHCISYLENIANFSEKLYPVLNGALEIWTTLASLTGDKKSF